MSAIPENRRAPDGMVWQCRACGKQAQDRYGMIGWHSQGWDESCMLNAAPAQPNAMTSAAIATDKAREDQS